MEAVGGARVASALVLIRAHAASEQEGELESLAVVQSGVAGGGVVQGQVVLGDSRRAAGALGDVLAGHLEVHAAEDGAGLGVVGGPSSLTRLGTTRVLSVM